MRFRPTALICIGMLASAAAVGLWDGEGTPVEHGPSRADAYWPTGPVVDILGINASVADYRERQQGTLSTEESADAMGLLESGKATKELGARWTRGHTGLYPKLSFTEWQESGGSWLESDEWVRAVQSAGLSPLAMIGPWSGNRTELETPRYALEGIEEAYLRFVRSAVERYDGDGVDDMPGLLFPVRFWEIDNQPDIKNAPARGRRARSGFATPQQFAEVVVKTARAIRAANAGSKILAGSIGRPDQSHGYEYMKELFRFNELRESVDVVSVHVHHRGPDVTRVENAIRRAQGVARSKPVWITETSVPSAGRHFWMSEAWQAELVFRTYLTALRLGAERVFWGALTDSENTEKKANSHRALWGVDASLQSREKPSAEAFRILSGLFEGVDWSGVRSLEIEGGRGVSIGQKGHLVYGETNWVVVPKGSFSEAVDLFTGEAVDWELRAQGRLAVNTNEKTVWLKP